MGIALKTLITASLFSIITFSTTSEAEIYKWTDENGKVHYSQFKPPPKNNKDNSQEIYFGTKNKNTYINNKQKNTASEADTKSQNKLQSTTTNSRDNDYESNFNYYDRPDITNDEKAYEFFKKGLKAKQDKQFNNAQILLEQAVSNIALNDESAKALTITDELFYFLPLARAEYAIEKREPNEAQNTLIKVQDYLNRHPKKIEYLKRVDEIITSAQYMEKALNGQELSRLTVIKLFLQEHFTAYGKYPKTKSDLKKILTENLGKHIKTINDNYEIARYSSNSDTYRVIFQNKRSLKKFEITN